MHFIVLFLLHLSLQHLAEIRFLRKRNLGMESEFAMQAVYGLCEELVPHTQPGSGARSFFARTAKPFSPPTPLYPFLTFHFPVCRHRGPQCPGCLAGVPCLLLPVCVSPPAQPRHTSCVTCVSARGHTYADAPRRMLRGGCSEELPLQLLSAV